MSIQDECKVIVEEFTKRGYQITLDEAEMIWDDYCRLIYFASWLPVEINRHVFRALMDLDITKEIVNK
jgi:hypothetical protein